MRPFACLLVLLLNYVFVSEARALQIPQTFESHGLVDSSLIKVDTHDASHLTVIVFLSARCPCSISHEPGLASLAREFGQEARFIGIHANADEPAEESRAHFKQASLPFPVIQDESSRLANQFGAIKTPHAFVLGKNGEILFQGGVDDSHDASKATRLYLKSALADLHAGRAPQINLARSIGCQIRR